MKKIDIKLSRKQKQTTDIENRFVVVKGAKRWEIHRLGVWN